MALWVDGLPTAQDNRDMVLELIRASVSLDTILDMDPDTAQDMDPESIQASASLDTGSPDLVLDTASLDTTQDTVDLLATQAVSRPARLIHHRRHSPRRSQQQKARQVSARMPLTQAPSEDACINSRISGRDGAASGFTQRMSAVVPSPAIAGSATDGSTTDLM
ncbi:hypothetical protein GCM10028778_26580 [Barrientosiimonas marina]